MADEQFLRIGLKGRDYLLPGRAGLAIEQRETLLPAAPGGAVSAWHERAGERWPALQLDAELGLLRGDDWHKAVFVDARPRPIGLIADEIQLLPRAEMRIEPFSPFGVRRAHRVVSAVRMLDGGGLVLVLDPASLAAYLWSLAESPPAGRR